LHQRGMYCLEPTAICGPTSNRCWLIFGTFRPYLQVWGSVLDTGLATRSSPSLHTALTLPPKPKRLVSDLEDLRIVRSTPLRSWTANGCSEFFLISLDPFTSYGNLSLSLKGISTGMIFLALRNVSIV